MVPNSVRSYELIKALYYIQPCTCADLSVQMNKSVPHTKKNINDLVQSGMVKETGLGVSSGGRRPENFSLATDAFYIISIAIDQHQTRIAIFNTQKQPVLPALQIIADPDKTNDLLDHICTEINQLLAEKPLLADKILGIGLSMPGFIDIKKGCNYTFFNEQTNIPRHIEELTGIPAFLDNDSSVVALAELRQGVRNERNVMVVNVGWGIGLGMILNGKMFRGHSGFAGEFSHIPLYKDGNLCSCGKRDCLETQASLSFIESQAKEQLRSGNVVTSIPENVKADIQTIFRYAKKGDEFCIRLISQAAYNIGRGLAILIHIINPELIVLSGWGAALGEIWLPPIQQAINENCIPRLSEKTSVRISKMAKDAALIGGAGLVIEHIDPELLFTNKTRIKILS